MSHAGCTVFIVLLMVRSPLHAERPLPRVPEGFVIEKVAGPPLTAHPIMAGFDDRGRLFVAENAGVNLRAAELLKQTPNSVRMLEDTDGDGTFDKSTVFADDMTFPQGALWYRGALYVASPPSIWRLEDTDGDGRADRRDEIVNRFGFTGNAADIHGCFLGPGGRLYWCDGRHGHEFIDENGRLTSKGKAARIFSCRPDGSDVQVWCGGGMDNPVEIDFTAAGEMLGTVNIMLSPRGDCLVHWMDGGVYPRHDQQDCLAEFQSTGDLLPPVTDFGHVAVSGMTRYRSAQFGPEYRDNLFITQFNTHKVTRSVLERSGATFRSREEDFLVSDDPDFHPTDVLEDADGSLLVIDTGGWFRIGCPTSQIAKPEITGAIYRIRRQDAPKIDDPRGLKLRWDAMSPEELVELLDDPRPAVRERAVDVLAQRGPASAAALDRVLYQTEGPTSESARRNAVWAYARMSPAGCPVVRALDDTSESVRIAAARALGTNREAAAVERLARSVVEDTPPVRREAATALGRICAAEATRDRGRAVAALFAGLRKDVTDRMLEHALIYAAIRIADREATIPFLGDSNPQVRRAALIALDQMHGGNLTRELVVPLLDTDDPVLQQTALEIIGKHAGWAKETLAVLRQWLQQPELTDERASVLRGFLLAQCGAAEIQQLVGASLRNERIAPPVRLLLLEVIQRSDIPKFPAEWLTALEAVLDAGSADLRRQAVGIVRDRQMAQFDDTLRQFAHGAALPPELRIDAVQALAPRMAQVDAALLAFLLGQLRDDVPPLTRLAAARALGDAPLTDGQLLVLAGHLDEAGPLALPVLLRAFGRSQRTDVGRALVAALERTPAATGLSADELAALLRSYPQTVQTAAAGLLRRLGSDLEAQRAKLAELAPLSGDGDALHGRSIFFGKKAACAGCHTVAGQGGKVGPDLTQIGRIRTGADLIEAVALPSASFARGYRTYTVLTAAGKVHTGVLSRETPDAVTLRTSDLAEIRISRAQIEEMKEAGTSIMPKGLETTLTRDELRDLLAYLQGLK